MSTRDVIYDPTDHHIGILEPLQKSDVEIDDLLGSPQAFNMLIQQYIGSLYELKALKAELTDLRGQNDILRDERGDWRVKLAESKVSGSVQFAEIVISFLGSFAINILTSDWRSGLGWAIFLLCLFILLSFRSPRLSKRIDKIMSGEEINGDN